MFSYQYSLKNEEEDDKKQPPPKKRPFMAFEQTFCASQVHFYLSDEIGEPHDYVEMIHRMLTAASNDIIFIHLNTPGGRLDTGVQIVNAMQNSQAKIVTVLESMAFSLGTFIFLAGDEMVVNDHCMVMFHNFKSGVVGKGQEMFAQLDATTKWFSALAKKIYIPFLTEDEFNKIIRGEDLWMHSPEIRKRLDRMIAHLAQTNGKSDKKKVRHSKVTKPEVSEPAK